MTIHSVIVPDHTELEQLSDAEVLALQADVAAWVRQANAAAARVAGEVARRCAVELGQDGLAQRTGLRSPEALIQHVTGVTRGEARGLLRVGELLRAKSPWLSDVTSAASEGTLSIAAADAIATGLGVPSAHVAADDLADAATRLVEVSARSTPERLAAAARAVRDDLDGAGIADREEHLRSKRFLRVIPQPDGMTKLIALLDPESAAVVTTAVDAVTAPRRGGPRFVDPAPGFVAASPSDPEDPRTVTQVAVDALVDMVRIATRADSGRVFAQKQPSVRVHVTLADLERRGGGESSAPEVATIPGRGYLEGTSAALSPATIQRLACATGYVPILFDQGQPLNVGRTERLFTHQQRTALAARDGGCIFPDCDRPASWCEAHHVNHWHRDRGNTDVADGVLLCQHHHLLTHNHGWEITRDGADYWFVPPAKLDPRRQPRPAQKRRQLVASRS